MLMVFEDLHWADESTLLLLRHLAQHLAKAPVLLIGTYRATDLEPGRPFRRMLEAFLRERLAEEIWLRGLTQEDVSALLAGRAGSRPPPRSSRCCIARPREIRSFWRRCSAT